MFPTCKFTKQPTWLIFYNLNPFKFSLILFILKLIMKTNPYIFNDCTILNDVNIFRRIIYEKVVFIIYKFCEKRMTHNFRVT